MKELIAQKLNHDFDIDGYIEIFDKNGNRIYYEDDKGYWIKSIYDENNNETFYSCSSGYWVKTEYDAAAGFTKVTSNL